MPSAPHRNRRARRRRALLVLASCALGPASCGGEATGPTPEDDAPGSPPEYVVEPPAGKLPWPQHAPAFTADEYARMMRDLFLVNNFGLYQGGADDPTSMYMHSGLDIVLPNGTPIHAVAPGVVRYITRGPESYKSIYISDLEDPDAGWVYVHVDAFEVEVGDTVYRGTRLAQVRFQGIEHVHLNRVERPPDGAWSDFRTLVYRQPDGYFHYEDAAPPVFDPTFHYFRNESDSAFAAGSPTVVSGDVDIVVGLRDAGEYARRATLRAVEERLAVTRIEYEIAGPDGSVVRRPSFDFGALALTPYGPGRPPSWQLAATVFKYYEAVFPGTESEWWETRFSYYIITNAPDPARPGPIDTADGTLAWRTADGPNGDYVITVRACDHHGNVAERTDTVRVVN